MLAVLTMPSLSWVSKSAAASPSLVSGLATHPASAAPVQVAVGRDHTCTLLDNGAIACWGDNRFGQLGDGSTLDLSSDVQNATPKIVLGLPPAKQVATGELFSCALSVKGGVWCWGAINGFSVTSTPTEVTGLSTGVTKISAGWESACALLASGSVECWGDNAQGQLGRGTTFGSGSAGPIASSEKSASDISVGFDHACLVTTDGTVECWGGNSYGQLGDGTLQDHTVPSVVMGLPDSAVSVNASGSFTCVVTVSNSAWCWGSNLSGQIGLRTWDPGFLCPGDIGVGGPVTPVAVSDLVGPVREIAGGYPHNGESVRLSVGGQTNDPCPGEPIPGIGAHTCALILSGDVYCWGLETWGVLGFDGYSEPHYPTVQVAGLSGASSLGVGLADHECAIASSTVWCWGRNDQGQLGRGPGGPRFSSSAAAVDANWNLPDSPSGVFAAAGNTQATIAWTDGSSNGSAISSQTIYVYSGASLVSTKTNCSGSPCTVTGLTNGTSYTFKVSDTNGVGGGALSDPSSAVTPAAVPSAPTITSATRGNTQATIAWTDGSSNGSAISSQTIYVYSGASLVSTKTNCSGSPCTVTGLTNGTSYTFKVSDTNGVGGGALSDPSSAVTPATYPGAPQNVSVVAAGGQAVVSWTPPASNGGSPIISYSVSAGARSCSYTVSSPETDSCTITGLTNGSSYTFSVTATNGLGAGSPSAGVPTTVLFPAPVLTSAVAAKNQITLTWTAPTVTDGKIVSFTGSASDGHGHTFYCSGAKSAKKCTITGLTDLTTYTTSVKATENNGGTISAPSNTISAAPAEPLTLPLLYAVSLIANPHTATFIWGSAGGGDGQTPSYTVRVFNPDGSVFSSTQTSGNTATATGLTKGVKYSYTITTSTSAVAAGWIPAATTRPVKFTAK